MTWSLSNLLIQIIGGILGGHAAAVAVKDYKVGWIAPTMAGLVGGGLSGCFFQTLAATMVTGAGDFTEPTPLEGVVLQGLTGAVVGGIATLIVAITRHSFSQNWSKKS